MAMLGKIEAVVRNLEEVPDWEKRRRRAAGRSSIFTLRQMLDLCIAGGGLAFLLDFSDEALEWTGFCRGDIVRIQKLRERE